LRGSDADEISPLFHLRPHLAQLGRHRCDAVSFLNTPAGDVAQRGRAVSEQSCDSQRHRRIGDVVAVEVDGVEHARLRCTRLHPVRPHRDLDTHLCQFFSESDITLHRILAHPLDA
jgi:hypothetical protein